MSAETVDQAEYAKPKTNPTVTWPPLDTADDEASSLDRFVSKPVSATAQTKALADSENREDTKQASAIHSLGVFVPITSNVAGEPRSTYGDGEGQKDANSTGTPEHGANIQDVEDDDVDDDEFIPRGSPLKR